VVVVIKVGTGGPSQRATLVPKIPKTGGEVPTRAFGALARWGHRAYMSDRGARHAPGPHLIAQIRLGIGRPFWNAW